MNQIYDLDNPELKRIFRKQLIRGAIFLLILVALIFTLALILEPQIRQSSEWLTQNFGFWGISVLVFVADLIVSPIPPDAALFFIGQSSMHSQWVIWVPLLGLISSIAGLCGWFFGKKLQHLRSFRKLTVYFKRNREFRMSVRRFGFWMVVIGAVTPLPFSVTCWLAGIFNLPLGVFMTASLVRVPRFVVYYWAIFYSGEVGSLLRDLIQFNWW